MICGELFWPDPRVGHRQRACSDEDCQKARRAATQARWRRLNRGYATGYRLRRRSAQAAAAARAVSCVGEGVLAPHPLRLPRVLDSVPWSQAFDRLGPEITDFVAVVAHALILAAAKSGHGDEGIRGSPSETW